ncbi:MAG: hypothetical protein WCW53_06320 [Syntrophales bacterium]|jgi:hypothetical protein
MSDFGAFFKALWGACLGWCLAGGLVLLVKAGAIALPGLLVQTFTGVPNEGLEKLFYLSFYVIGPCCALLAVLAGPRFFRAAGWAGFAVAVFLPLAPRLTKSVLVGPVSWFWIVVPPLVLCAGAVLGRVNSSSVRTQPHETSKVA